MARTRTIDSLPPRPPDLVSQWGELALATRLRRLSERLMKDISRVYGALQVDFEARWFTVLYLLGQKTSLPVTGIADALGLTHPAIIQIISAMAEKKLVTSKKDARDERRRLVSLTPKGRETIRTLTPVWETITEATREVLEQSGTDLLSALGRMEQSLDEAGMFERVTARIKERQRARIEILDYAPRYKKYFRSLNLEWLRAQFRVEPLDEALLGDPNGRILKRGGDVLFARLDGEIIGTAALLKCDRTTYELAKMAVTPKAQGQQVGRRLAVAILDRARARGARLVILETSPKLETAINLYRSLGFRTRPAADAKSTKYDRPTFLMTLDLAEPRP